MPDTPETRARRITADVLGVDPDAIQAESSLRSDLHMDSLDAVSLAMALEEEFDVEIVEETLDRARTFGDLLRIVTAPVEA